MKKIFKVRVSGMSEGREKIFKVRVSGISREVRDGTISKIFENLYLY